MAVRRGLHPRRTDWLRRHLVKYNPFVLTLFFVASLAAAAALLGLGLTIDTGSWGSFPRFWRNEGMALLGLTIDAPDANTGSPLSQVVLVAQGLLGLILPALFIATVVFRLFIHPDVFVFRGKIALQPSPKETFRGELDRNGYVLAIRVYNASPLRALEVQFSAVHQRWFGSDENSVVRNVPVPVANPIWPMADRPVPYTLFVKLKVTDVIKDDHGLRLETLQGEEISKNDRLVVHVCGSMPEVGETFVERHAFDLPAAVTNEPYGRIRLQYKEDPKTWGGWKEFDV
jgi:hypothetical protein